MAKNNPKNKPKNNSEHQPKKPQLTDTPPTSSAQREPIQPEQMSLTAHKHIKSYLGNRKELEEKEVTAVLNLGQHLRVFGLLSAAGYINQTNDQKGEKWEKTVPVWTSLLGQLFDEQNPPNVSGLMKETINLAEKDPIGYMKHWRRSLQMANYWSFWARAYKAKEEQQTTGGGYAINPLP